MNQRQVEPEVPENELKFRAIVEATPECVKVVSLDGSVAEMNAAGLQMVEAERAEDVIGRCAYDFIAPEHREAYREFNERVCRGERRHLEFDFIGLAGTRRSVESHAVPLSDGKGRQMQLSVTRDVTDRKRAEAERNLLASIIDSSDDIIVSKTLDGVITSWNRGAEEILGYTPEEVIGKNVSVLVPPEAIDDMKKILDAIRKGEKVDHYETKRRRKNGAIIDVSLTVSPVRDGAGNIVGASKVGRDITEQKRAAVAVKEANRRKDEFLAMFAHELRNPLSAISNAVLVAQKGELNETLQWSTEVIERQVKQLARLIDDLFDISRIIQGKIQLRREVVDIGPIINSAVDTVRPLIQERKHELSVSFGPGFLRVNADPVRLMQVAVNLLTNAAKYTRPGGRIWLTAERNASNIVIQFRDTGVGIPPEKLPEMFELFVQAEQSLAHSEGGLGIGLALVKSLVEMHGGSISASSEGIGKGSEFSVCLPAVVSSRIEAAAARPVSAGGTPSSHILVVDDNADSARGLARLLKLLGHDVRTAHDGAEAIAIAEAYRPEVVLLDIGLPIMDGYEVASRLRASGNCKDSTIVAVSGYGQDDDRRRTREAGFNFHLVKPIDFDVLVKVLATAKGLSEARAENASRNPPNS